MTDTTFNEMVETYTRLRHDDLECSSNGRHEDAKIYRKMAEAITDGFTDAGKRVLFLEEAEAQRISEDTHTIATADMVRLMIDGRSGPTTVPISHSDAIDLLQEGYTVLIDREDRSLTYLVRMAE